MLVSLPCVTTGAGSIGELARHNETALVVPIRDTLALREALALLISDGSLRSRLGDAARAHCLERYSLERMLDQMERVFVSLLPGKP
jgi:glycosyltransferase involved in cell wall biosynthesis